MFFGISFSKALSGYFWFFRAGYIRKSIQAEVMPANEPSKRVLLKNGFIKEGLLRQAALWPGKGIVDLEVFSILKEDYAK